MAHGGSNPANTLVTNGATLEDCHTNVFVLTEVNGLRWCKYTASHSEAEVYTDVGEDQILRAYVNCLKQDLLCVWRRVPQSSASSSSNLHSSSSGQSSTPASAAKIDLRLAAEKEFWVFWYGEEQPTALKTICASLTRAEESWNNGVEYETRLLLFKALHNLLERSLLSREYVRLGRFFVQPLTAEEAVHPPKYLLAFTFSFFIHGDTNVCVNVTVQRQPPICRLSRAHLIKRENGAQQKVSLAPFGIAANLSRNCNLNIETDNQATKLWKEWSEFYPLPDMDNTENMGYVDAAEKERQDQLRALAPPRMVEVIVHGVRLKYPTAFVLVECQSSSSSNNGSITVPNNNSNVTNVAAGGEKPVQSNAAKLVNAFAVAGECGPIYSGVLLQRVAEELSIGISSPSPSSSNNGDRRPSQTPTRTSTPTPDQQQQSASSTTAEEAATGSWEFVDSTHKDPCGCGRSSSSSSSAANSLGSLPKAPSPAPVLNKAQLKFGSGYMSGGSGGATSGTSTTAPSTTSKHQKFVERQNRLSKSGPFHRKQLATTSRSNSNSGTTTAAATTTTTTTATSGGRSSVPSTPQGQTTTAEINDPITTRTITTPVTPAAAFAATPVQQPPSSSCPVGQPTVSNSHSEPTMSAAQASTTTEAKSSAAKAAGDQQTAASRHPDGPSALQSSSSSISIPSVIMIKPPLPTIGRNKRRSKLLQKTWKRPRLSIKDTMVNFGLGLSCPHDESAPSPPPIHQSLDWCVKKVQKHELAIQRPFVTPNVQQQQQQQQSFASSTALENSSYYGMPKISPISNSSSSMPSSLFTGGQHHPPQHHHAESDQQQHHHHHQYQHHPIGSMGVVTNSVVNHPTSPATTISTPAQHKMHVNSLPENIMEDSPTDMSHEFLSPPPSHGHDGDENVGQHITTTMNSRPPTLTNSITTTTTTTSGNQSINQSAKSRVDYNMIYPTPPSIETPAIYDLRQFSPEAASNLVALSSGQRSNSPGQTSTNHRETNSIGDHYASGNGIGGNGIGGEASSSKLLDHFLRRDQSILTVLDRLQQKSKVVDYDCVAKFISANTYSPKNFGKSNGNNRRIQVPAWTKSEPMTTIVAGTMRGPIMASARLALPPPSSISQGQGLRPPASPFFPYTSPAGPGQHSQPGSPVPSIPPPPPYQGIHQPQRGWQSPGNAVMSPFGIRPKTPGSVGIYDIQSPVSNASSSMCMRNDNSIEGGMTIGRTPSEALSAGEGLPTPEGHGLVLSLLMCDTVADLFRDASFDSCPLCVCSMSILGVDAGVYVVVSNAAATAAAARQSSNILQNPMQNSQKCNCGFSAVRYRNLSWRAGLFYEDEFEATGVWPSTSATSTASNNNDQSRDQNNYKTSATELINIVRYNASTDYDLTVDHRMTNLIMSTLTTASTSSTKDLAIITTSSSTQYIRPLIELRDLSDVCNLAVEQACLMMDCTKPSRDDFHSGGGKLALGASNRFIVSDWGYLKSVQQATNGEACFIMRNLSPILHESMQKSRGVGGKQYVSTVEGPLTWRHLHRKCGHRSSTETRSSSTTNDSSAPEPIPLLLCATDRDWITVSPFALRSWDKLPLEPYGQPKDIVYIAVVPDNSVPAENSVVQQKARQFFRSLSRTYETLRLGRHCPITRVLKDGIMPVNKKYMDSLRQAAVDPSFDRLIEQCPRLGAKLKSYAQICRHYLAPHLGTENVFDRSIFRDMGNEGAGGSTSGGSGDGASSSMPPPSSIPGREQEQNANGGQNDQDGLEGDSDNSPVPHTVVIYIVDAFTFGPQDREDAQFSRVAAAGLHRCYLEVLRDLPDSVKSRVQLEIIPLQSIFETNFNDAVTGCSQADYLRRLAFSVFQQPRCLEFSCLTSSVAKPLTGFGTAASRLELIRRKTVQQKDAGGFGNYYRAHCPAVILAPTFEKGAISLNSDVRDDGCRVLFVSYCLSERQEWLIATATDHQGALLEDCTIDLRVPNRRCITRRPIASVSNGPSGGGGGGGGDQGGGPEGSMIWESLRKLWNFVTALLSTATHPWRIVIGRYGRLGHEELKAWAHFLSRSRLRMTSKLIRERCGMCAALPATHDSAVILSACLISTEPDQSLRLFPNSFAHDDRFGLGGKHCPLSTPEDVSVTHVMVFPTSAAIHVSQNPIAGSISGNADDVDDGFDGLFDALGGMLDQEFSEITAGVFEDPDTGRSFHQQQALAESGDEQIQLQPLALGYAVSTAPAGWMPDWFWTNRPSARNQIPVHLRSSLHIHTSGVQQSDEQFLQATSSSTSNSAGAGSSRSGASHAHPLDSSLTTDVLRYVLETYNSLSWLTFDNRTGDRRSCMPVHIQHLLRLYRAMDGFEFK